MRSTAKLHVIPSSGVEHGRVYRIREVAELLKVSEATVYKAMRDGKLKTIKPAPRATRITAEDLEAYLQNLRDQ
jgi:excisionase family DNA binding protein